ncbi:MAG: TRAP transporter small permease [Alphaproteobacteria bacterium]|nr:TRAP transporter small permease [Alphaproteobacteria bacterium]
MSGHSHQLRIAKHGGNPVLKTIGFLSSVCGVAAAFLIVGSVLLTCQMIIVRYVLNESTVWQTEMVVFMMIGATMLGLPYVQKLRGHVNVDLLPMLLPPWARIWLFLATSAMAFAVMAIMIYYGYDYFAYNLNFNVRSDSVWGPLLWPVYLTVPVGFGLYSLQLLADFYATLVGIEKPFDLEDEERL